MIINKKKTRTICPKTLNWTLKFYFTLSIPYACAHKPTKNITNKKPVYMFVFLNKSHVSHFVQKNLN